VQDVYGLYAGLRSCYGCMGFCNGLCKLWCFWGICTTFWSCLFIM